MVSNYFPSLVVQSKWHTQRRNLEKGDVVLIQDKSALRGEWKMGRVSKPIVSEDGFVRSCEVKYKQPGEGSNYAKGFVTITRPVQRLILLVPASDVEEL